MKRGKLFLVVLVFFLVVPGITLCFQGVSEAQGTAMKVKIGQKAPDFTLKSLDGEEITLSRYFGKKVVMLEFWATWCDICKKEIPTLIKDYNKYKDKGFELLAIALETGDAAKVRKMVEEKGIPYPVLIDSDLKVATKIYRLAGPIPLKVIIGVDGTVKYTHVGDYPPGENEVPFVLDDLVKEVPE
ncbi:MAG: TlpA family protein disulfide reductase [Deltaproteobacteria bacterium]|nr:TlpA family protein disulfide reductase [Deltaproteobacteria bacterium]